MEDGATERTHDAPAEDKAKRFRSEIEFPYADLESAVDLVSTLHGRTGSSADVEELAAWMNQSPTGGTFRTRISAARIFGLIDTGQGRVTITQLGREILNKTEASAARVTAFLKAQLFSAMYDQFKGNVLPPPAAVERFMEQVGVSPKQKERARQTFMKSATYAGFIDPASGRFIKPGIVGSAREESSADQSQNGKKGGGGSNEPPEIDPIIQGLLARLPRSGDIWPEAERKLWLQLLEGSFKLIYKDKDTNAN
jgi:hypothetical protein